MRRDQLIVACSLAFACAVSWAWLVPAARDMYGAMNGPAAWMMAATWDTGYAFRIFLMWAVMMVGMMLPSAAPVVLLYAGVVRKAGPMHSPVRRTYLFVGGYLVAWTAFSAVATVLQAIGAKAALLSPMMETASPWLGAVILGVAGVYQLTASKRACLAQCRQPAQFIAQHWRAGDLGALRMGVEHGLFCVGCCWALMALLFAGGVMNLAWIAGITLFVLVEKLAPMPVRGGLLSGVALIGAALAVAVRAAGS